MKKVLISLCVLFVLLCGTATLTACGEDETPRYTVTLDADGGVPPVRLHHEIYLGDPRRTKPENLRTVLRHPVQPASA